MMEVKVGLIGESAIGSLIHGGARIFATDARPTPELLDL
jgi:hypothetical protein